MQAKKSWDMEKQIFQLKSFNSNIYFRLGFGLAYV